MAASRITGALSRQCIRIPRRGYASAPSSLSSPPDKNQVYSLLDKAPRDVTRADLLLIKNHFRQFDAEPQTSVTFDPGFAPGIGLITLRNPKRLNAFTGRQMAELTDIVDALEAATEVPIRNDITSNEAMNDQQSHGDHGPIDSLVGIILHGEGRAFCAGLDLTVARNHIITSASGALMSLLMRDTILRLRRLSLISVAAIEGVAFGAGAELATTCDFRIMARDARVRFVQTKMFTTPVWAGGAFGILQGGRGASRSNALRALGAAELLTASKALDFGFADGGDHPIVDKGMTLEAAKAFLDPFVFFDEATGGPESDGTSQDLPLSLYANHDRKRNSVQAVRGMKRIVSDAVDPVDQNALMDLQHQLFCGFWGSKDNQDAIVNMTRK